MKIKKMGFTLVEVIIIVLLISIGIITVVNALNLGNKYLQKSRQKIIAINLAREGIEQMINIRDTNRKIYSSNKEETWLKVDPTNNGNIWFSSGVYILSQKLLSGQKYIYGSGIINNFNNNEGLSKNNLQFSMCKNKNNRISCPGENPTNSEGAFFRRVIGFGLYDKFSNTEGGDFKNCISNIPVGGYNCGDSSAKEYRFCVIVDYFGEINGNIELCSILTNFKK